jgi:hypothetical protein
MTTLQEEVDALRQELDDQTDSGQAQRKRKAQTEGVNEANTHPKRREAAVNDDADLEVSFDQDSLHCVHPGMHLTKLNAHH